MGTGSHMTKQSKKIYLTVSLIIFYSGSYHFTSGNDGYYDTKLKSFENREKFVQWLSAKNDYKMAGYDKDDDLYEKDECWRGNQRINKQLLQEFINNK